ncbi:hypothetical protein ACO0LM_23185 [Undibacterium sp. Di26W]|uniref:hypothetical protein n=1 Tax=Undibacterium sp. Di26W TaxID=3413035 RepID=UPI003BF21BC1
MLSLLKLNFVRNVLIGCFLLYLIGKITSVQYIQNILGLPVLLWIAGNVIYGLGHNRRVRKKFEKKVHAFCKFTDDNCLDICDGSAIAIHYDSKTIYLINNTAQIALQPSQVLRWEIGMARDEVKAKLTSATDYAPSSAEFTQKQGGVSHVTFWIGNGAYNVFTVLVSSEAIVNRLKHFSLVNNIAIA